MTREPRNDRVPFGVDAVARESVARSWSEHPALRHYGMRGSVGEDSVVAVIAPLEAHHRGGLGTDAVHGGILAGMFDFVLGVAGALCLKVRTGTLQLSMTFMRPVRGDSVEAEGWCEALSRNHAYTAAVIRDQEGRICGRAHGVVSVVREGATGPA